MASPANLPAIALTARDHATLTAEALRFFGENYPGVTTDLTEAQPMVALTEMVTWGLAQISYLLNVAANESYLSTARQRANVINIVDIVNYVPSLATAASVDLALDVSALTPYVSLTILGASAGPFSVRAAGGETFEVLKDFTLSATNGGSTWTVISDNTVPKTSTTPEVQAVHGKTQAETFSGTGTQFQSFQLSGFPVIENSISVSVGSVPWKQVERVVTGDSADILNQQIYEVEYDAQDRATIRFGNGTMGAVPQGGDQDSEEIVAVYRTGGGEAGNIGSGTISGTLPATATKADGSVVEISIPVTNQRDASGGAPREDLDSIKFFAPEWSQVCKTAVTPSNFRALSAGYTDGVTGASAKAGVISTQSDALGNIVTVYLWTRDNKNILISPVPSALKDSLRTFLQERAFGGVVVTVTDGKLVSVNLGVIVRISPSFNVDEVITQVNLALDTLFKSARVRHGNELRTSWILGAIASVKGVAYCHLASPAGTVETATAQEVEAGTLPSQSGALITEVILPSGSSSVTDYYANYRVEITGGTGVGQIFKILSYNGSTKKATIATPGWTVAPTAGSTYRVWHPRIIKLAASSNAANDYYNRRVISITSGAGAGQTRTLVDYDGTTKLGRLGHDWDVPPGANSTYVLLTDLRCAEDEGFVLGAGTSITALSGSNES